MKNFLQKTIILLIIFIFIFPAIFNFNKKIAFAVGESWSYDFTMAGEVKHVKNPFGFDSLVKCEVARKDFMDNTVSKNPGLYTVTQCESVTIYYYEYGLKLSDGTYSTSPSQNFTTLEECEVARKKIADNPNYNPNTSKISPACIPKGEAIVYVTPGANTGATSSSVYNLLAPIGTFKVAPDNIGDYFNTIFLIAIGLCGALAVIMIVIGGIQYMGDESIFGKTEAKSRITSAILGLLIALGAFALLNTINPALLGGNINIKQVSAEIGGDTDVPTVFNKNTLPTGIVCSGDKSNIPNIAQSFSGKMTYEMGAKGVAGPNNTIKLDCSGFVNYVLDCANANFVSGGTTSIFANAEKVTSISGTTINNIELKIGDLIGWRAGENEEKFGHVMIYIGGGQFADSHSNTNTGSALGTFSISKYQSRIKYIKRIP